MKRLRLISPLLVCLISAGLAGAAETPAIWIDVPFVTQTRDGCGPAVISMVMQYWAKQIGPSASSNMDPVKIQALLTSPGKERITASAMEEYFQRAGYRTFAFRGEWNDLQHHLSQGRPLIVSLKASGSHGPLHYAVVVGADSVRGYVFLNDPAATKMLRISREGFESEWSLASNWMLLAVPGAGN
ncbi:MAG: C39 family peptidase [Acidobacteriia bacterium]|nr:C39 family peptidase [Terriglobia bacterium]